MTRPIPFDQDWHVYAVEWNEGEISWWVDEKQYGRATRADAAPHRWPFDDRPFYLLPNRSLRRVKASPCKALLCARFYLLSTTTQPGLTSQVARRDYLQYYPKLNEPRVRVINLCDTTRHLSQGCYCSLLAEARHHQVLPTVKVINALRDDYATLVEPAAAIPRGGEPLPDELIAAAKKMSESGCAELDNQIYHYGGTPSCSWYQFAEAIFAGALAEGVLPRVPQVNAITTADYPTPAQRPAYSILPDQPLTGLLELAEPSWQRGLQRLLAASH